LADIAPHAVGGLLSQMEEDVTAGGGDPNQLNKINELRIKIAQYIDTDGKTDTPSGVIEAVKADAIPLDEALRAVGGFESFIALRKCILMSDQRIIDFKSFRGY
jgi:hypothetical protein